MSNQPKRWSDFLAAMPRLTEEQIAAVKEVVDRHLGWLAIDYPKVDDAHYQIQTDLDALKDSTT